ncbi:methyl-accepting chemotaxis protein [Massilia sp. BSC265]|uniref:methyl-accepting chemotaxis protein n=1 Tax=Massilia sp. BSC265 TaxID=1549812 RepID=UPI0009DF9CC5|nr:methyl-accepting chemotaxis protein [Massilia sp. BSC265]
MLQDLKVGTRLLLGFFIVSLIGAMVAGIGIRNMGKINDRTDLMYHQELLGISAIKEANLNLSNLGRSLRNALLAPTQEARDQYLADAQATRELMQRNLATGRQLIVTERGKAVLLELDNQLQPYLPMIDELVNKIRSEPLQANSSTIDYMFNIYAPALAPVTHKLTELSRLKEDYAKEISEESKALYASARGTMVFLVMCAMAAGLGLGVMFTRSLTRQLGGEPAYAVAVAGRIASGDLATDVELRPGDDSSLLFAMRTMRDSLATIVSQVRGGTESIASGSRQIASGNLDLSARTEEQASSLEETASSMEELTSTVKHNADNARQANQLAVAASEVAGKGGAMVAQVVQTMGSINESARKIVDIIGVIDGIAFQTNILALNAAVEAARAGEQGRGFAVVASEVRNLAQRSASAAKEIKALIDESVRNVDSGARLVDEAGDTMKDIVERVVSVAGIIGEITVASQEQAGGIDQINQAISQMDQVTQQNASLVEEAAAASDALQDQARKLAQLVSMFKLGAQTQPGKPAGSAAQAAPPQSLQYSPL